MKKDKTQDTQEPSDVGVIPFNRVCAGKVLAECCPRRCSVQGHYLIRFLSFCYKTLFQNTSVFWQESSFSNPFLSQMSFPLILNLFLGPLTHEIDCRSLLYKYISRYFKETQETILGRMFLLLSGNRIKDTLAEIRHQLFQMSVCILQVNKRYTRTLCEITETPVDKVQFLQSAFHTKFILNQIHQDYTRCSFLSCSINI